MPSQRRHWGPRMRSNRGKLAALCALLLVFVGMWVLASYSGGLANSATYRQGDIWWSLKDGSTVSRVSNSIANGDELIMGYSMNQSSAVASWQMAFPEYHSIQPLNPKTYLVFPHSTWSRVMGSNLSFYLNGFEETFTYNNKTTAPGLGVVYGLNASANPLDGNLHVAFPSEALQPENNVTVVVPPYTIAYVNPVNLVADASGTELLYAGGAQARAVLVLPAFAVLFLACLYLAYIQMPAVVYVFSGGLMARFLIAPFTEHIFDIEVAKRTVEIFYSVGSLNLGTFSYGPLWLLTNVWGVSPAFALGGLPGGFVLNMFLKVPAILADGATFILLYSILARAGVRRALFIASLAWLFNPLVFWTTAIHGMYSSIIALLIVSVLLLVETRPWLGASLIGIGGAFLPVLLILFIPLLLIHRNRFLSLVCSASIGFFPAYLLPYIVFENGLSALLNGPLLQTVLSRLAVLSDQSYQFVVFRYSGILLSPLVGLVFATIATVAYLVFVRPPPQSHFLETCRFFAIFVVAFYLTYPTLYYQHAVWIIPLLVILGGLTMLSEKSLVTRISLFSLFFLVVAFTTNYLSDALQAFVVGTSARTFVLQHSMEISEISGLGPWIALLEIPIFLAILAELLRPIVQGRYRPVVKRSRRPMTGVEDPPI
jgi:hypothetical protein